MQEMESKAYLANGAQPEAEEAVAWAFEQKAQMVDLKFADLFGSLAAHDTARQRVRHRPRSREGLGFDGSSIRGWQGIAESDLLLMPDPASAVLDPFTEASTLSLVCEIADPTTGEAYGRDPRRVARRAEEHLRETGIADTANFGPECEFFVFDEVSYELAPHRAHYSVDSAEGHWNSGDSGPRLHRAREGRVLPAGAPRHAARPAHPRSC